MKKFSSKTSQLTSVGVTNIAIASYSCNHFMKFLATHLKKSSAPRPPPPSVSTNLARTLRWLDHKN